MFLRKELTKLFLSQVVGNVILICIRSLLAYGFHAYQLAMLCVLVQLLWQLITTYSYKYYLYDNKADLKLFVFDRICCKRMLFVQDMLCILYFVVSIYINLSNSTYNIVRIPYAILSPIIVALLYSNIEISIKLHKEN